MKKNLPIIFILIALNSIAQDVHFSQLTQTPLLINPGFVASGHSMLALANYKAQWNTIPNAYKTINFSFDMLIKKNKAGAWGFGINVFSDKSGDGNLSFLFADFMTSYHLKLNEKNKIGIGIAAGLGQRSINLSSLKWSSQFDGLNYNSSLASGEQQGSASIFIIDGGAGLLWSYKKNDMYMTSNDNLQINAGFSVDHINQPNYSFVGSSEKLFLKYTFHADAVIGIKSTPLSFAPGAYFFSQGSQKELIAGTSIKYLLKEESKYTGFVKGSAISIGCFYRNKDALIITSLIEFDKYALGFSYDVNTSGLTNATAGRGGFEISLKFVNPNPFGGQKNSTKFNK
jgi:type IX secretion system PorP/SprF family membrane protein